MLQSLKNLSKAKKIGIGAGAGVLAVLLAVMAVWQPWKQEEAPPEDDQQGVTDQVQKPGGAQENEEKPVTLRVGNKEIPCVIYEGDGWSVYVPEDWTAEKDGEAAARFTSPEGASAYVVRLRETSGLADTYASLYPGEGTMNREFYTGDGQNGWHLTFSAPVDRWEDFDHLFRAIARTGELDGEKPFDAWTPMPEEPDWQNIDGDTLIFTDKDGVPVSDTAEEAVRARMLSWSPERKAAVTGRYDFELAWRGSYVQLGENQLTDVFGSQVAYEIKAGQEENVSPTGGEGIENGWLKESSDLYLIATQNGGPVEKKLAYWSNDCAPGDLLFASDVTDVLAGRAPSRADGTAS